MSATKPLQPRRRPKQERARLTQQAILDAFVRLLLEKGYARLTIRDIADLAGVGLGTVYGHFVDLWQRALQASGRADEAAAREAAYVIHAAVYGLLYQTLMLRPEAVAAPLFRQQLGLLVQGFTNAQNASQSGKMHL